MPDKARPDSRKVNQLSTAARLCVMKAARLLLEAEYATIKGDLDAIQKYHLQMSELIAQAYDTLGEVQNICKENGDASENDS